MVALGLARHAEWPQRGPMRRWARGVPWVLCLVASAAMAQPTEATPTGVLQVDVVGFRDTTGRAVIALFDREDGWLDVARAARVVRAPVRGGSVLATFEGLRRGGDYAVSVIHDADRDDRLDMEWLPVPHPAEGAGASRNPRPTLGPPSWGSARFRFERDVRIVVTLRY